MARGDPTAAAWGRLVPLLPRNGERPGEPWRPHRKIINGIRWMLRTGAGWRASPRRRDGPWPTCYGRFVRWQRDGTWGRVLQALQGQADAAGAVDWEVSVDGSVTRAHQHAADTRHRPARAEKGGPLTRPMRRSGIAGAASRRRATAAATGGAALGPSC